jgi:hypothetical protein
MKTGRIAVRVQTEQKVHETLSQSVKAGHVGARLSSHLCKKAHGPGLRGINSRPYLKITKTKRARGCGSSGREHF